MGYCNVWDQWINFISFFTSKWIDLECNISWTRNRIYAFFNYKFSPSILEIHQRNFKQCDDLSWCQSMQRNRFTTNVILELVTKILFFIYIAIAVTANTLFWFDWRKKQYTTFGAQPILKPWYEPHRWCNG
jgi:hypothetical protein